MARKLFFTKKILLFFTLVTISSNIIAQNTEDSYKSIKGFLHSPNVSSLGVFGQIPVSHYTGIPSINIPLYSIKGNNEPLIDISLIYHTSLIKPKTVPSWVGLGWGLSVGGSITRTPNGRRDEAGTDIGYRYIDNYSLLDINDWTSTVSSPPSQYQTDIFYHQKDLEPDEFTFNFGQYSGSFWLNHLGEWQVRSSNGMPLKIEAELSVGDAPSIYIADYELGVCHPTEYKYEKAYMQFTITTEDGTRYIFGSNAIGNSNIDFCEDSPNYKNNNFVEGNHARILKGSELYSSMDVPKGYIDTWQLRKIVSVDNREVNFNYIRKTVISTSSRYISEQMQSTYSNDLPVFSSTLEESVLIQTPVYLQSISSENFEIILHSSSSAQLKPTITPVSYIDTKWEKLDSIIIKSKDNNFVKKIEFDYIDNSQERLKLFSVSEVSADNRKRMTHTFQYNQTKMPPYNSNQLDHWGYYNGNTYTATNIYEDRSIINPNYLKAEIIEQITYPTGGKAIFEFEPHKYSRHVIRPQSLSDTYTLSDFNIDIEIGGLRVKRIKLLDINNGIVKDTRYFYSINYLQTGAVNQISSGILAGIPRYSDRYTVKCNNNIDAFLYVFNDKNPGTLSFTNGSHITYSEVIEVEEGNGFTVYTFTNFDKFNEYMDVKGVYYYLSENQKDYVFTSKSFMRGKLLSKVEYSESKEIKKQTQYQYKLYPATECLVRAVVPWVINGPCGTITAVGAAYGFLTNNYNLEKQIVNDYYGGNKIVNTTKYIYNQYNLISEQSFIQSNDVERITKYSYPFDLMTNEPNDVLTKMTNSHILSNPVESYVTLGSGYDAKVIAASHNVFYEVHPNIFKPIRTDILSSPVNIRNWLIQSSQFVRPKVHFKYDERGNIVEVKPEGGQMATTYLWGYNYQYPVAKIENTTYNDFMNSLSGSQKSFLTHMLNQNMIYNNPMYASFQNLLINAVPNTHVTTYTYKPLVGMTSQTDPKKITTFFEYDSFNRLQFVKDKDEKCLQSFDYNYKY